MGGPSRSGFDRSGHGPVAPCGPPRSALAGRFALNTVRSGSPMLATADNSTGLWVKRCERRLRMAGLRLRRARRAPDVPHGRRQVGSVSQRSAIRRSSRTLRLHYDRHASQQGDRTLSARTKAFGAPEKPATFGRSSALSAPRSTSPHAYAACCLETVGIATVLHLFLRILSEPRSASRPSPNLLGGVGLVTLSHIPQATGAREPRVLQRAANPGRSRTVSSNGGRLP